MNYFAFRRSLPLFAALLCSIFFLSQSAAAATTLTAGDIVIIGVGTDDPDDFHFVPLVDLDVGTEITFTDSGWQGSGFRGNEGAVKYTAPASVSAGTIISLIADSADFVAANDANVGNNGFVLSTGGDQVLAFQGTSDNPTFIFAVQTNSTEWQTGSNDSNQSDLPTGLVDGETAVAVGAGVGAEDEVDNAWYSGSTTSGTREEILAAVADAANWTGDNANYMPMTNDFTVGDAGPVPPRVTSTDPANGATNVPVTGNITLNFNESVDLTVDAVTIECPSGSAVSFTGLPASDVTSVTLNPDSDLPNSETCEVVAVSAEITDNDDTPDNLDGNGDGTAGDDFTFTFSTAAPPGAVTPIHDIQGSGDSVTGAGPFTVRAIVVGDYQGANGTDDFKLDGFFIQEEDADADANDATSEGIFVFCGICATDVAEGDLVEVVGSAEEFFGMSQLTLDGGGSVTVISSTNQLPTPATVTLPVPNVTATTLNGAQDQINAYFEQFEGMLITVHAELTVAEYFQMSRYGEIVLTADGRARQYTDGNIPTASGFTAAQIEYARRSIILDDDSNQQNHALFEGVPVYHPQPGFSVSNFMRGGDTVTGMTGVLHWSFAGQAGTDAWRVRPTENAVVSFTPDNPRTATPTNVNGTLRVASFNVLNYFNGNGSGGGFPTARGANSFTEFVRQRIKIYEAIAALDADVVGLIEIENDGFGSTGALADLVNALNQGPCFDSSAECAALGYADPGLGAGTYDFVSVSGGGIGSDEIAVGFIYKPASVSLVGSAVLDDASFTNPNNASSPKNRAALAATFEDGSGERFTATVNHFKSKGSSCGAGDDDTTTGQGNCNDTRTKAANALAAWLATDPTGSGDEDFMILGDLNAYRREDPIRALESAGYIHLSDPDSYSYLFDGKVGFLDYALANDTLFDQVTGVTEWNINADEVSLLDYNDAVRDNGEADFHRKPDATDLYDGDAYRSSDHDPILVGLSLGASDPIFSITGGEAVAEGDSGTVNLPFTVTRGGNVDVTATVEFATTDGTATAASGDYQTLTTTVSFAVGETTQTVNVAINGDTAVEADESVGAQLSAASSGTIATATAEGTITNDDSATVTLTGGIAQNEGDSGTVVYTFTVTLDNAVQGAFDLAYTTDDGTATAGSDYVDDDGVFDFAGTEGEAKTLTILVNGDEILEPDETFEVTLGAFSGTALTANLSASGSPQIGTITNDDAADFAISDAVAVVEGDSGTVNAVVTVTLSADVQGSVTVDYTTADDSATSEDYIAQAGTLTFAGNAGEQITITVPITGDETVEADEIVTVVLSNPSSGVTLSDDTGEIAILNDDSATVTLTGGIAQSEGDLLDTTDYIFTATLDNAVQGGFDLAYATNDGTATTANGDYTDNDGALTFAGAAGEAQTITVVVIGDNTTEADETFDVTLDSVSNGVANVTVDATPQVATILNDDGLAFSVDDVSVVEGDSGTTTITFTVSADGTLTGLAMVDYTTNDGTATTADGDYNAESGTLTFTDTTPQTVVVIVNGDEITEGDETFTLALSEGTIFLPQSEIVDGEGVATIEDDDSATLSIADVSVNENSTATLTVTMDTTSAVDVTVALATADGEAISVDDYISQTITLTIPAGQTAVTTTVAIVDDLLDENDETFSVSLSDANGAVIADGTAVVTIVDNDDPPTLSVTGATISETHETVTFTVSLLQASGLSVTVDFATADGSAVESADYISTTGSITIPAGQTSATVAVTINDDTIAENDETFTLTLSNPTNSTLGTAMATATIQDDEVAAVTIAPETASIAESGSEAFTVTLSAEPTAPVTITLTSQDADECVPSPAFVVLDSGNWDSGVSFNVDGVQDDTVDGDQSCTIAVAVESDAAQFSALDPADPQGGVPHLTVTITDTSIPTAIALTTQQAVSGYTAIWFLLVGLLSVTGWSLSGLLCRLPRID